MIQLDWCGLLEEAINHIRKVEENMHQLKRKRDNLLAIQSGKKATKEKWPWNLIVGKQLLALLAKEGRDACGGFWRSLKIMAYMWRPHTILAQNPLFFLGLEFVRHFAIAHFTFKIFSLQLLVICIEMCITYFLWLNFFPKIY